MINVIITEYNWNELKVWLGDGGVAYTFKKNTRKNVSIILNQYFSYLIHFEM